MIRLRILRWEDYSELSGWASCNHHKDPYKRGQEGQRERMENATLFALNVEDGLIAKKYR